MKNCRNIPEEAILSGSTLYGTTEWGGPSGWGTVFAVNTDGTGFQTLYSFTNGVDGGGPECVLVLSGNTLYGTTSISYYPYRFGNVFALETNGSSFTILHAFSDSDGVGPSGGLTLSGNTLYGSTTGNTLFAINTDGSAFTTLFSGTVSSLVVSSVGLILSGDTLYGANVYGGVAGAGSVWAINTNGTGFTTLYSFAATSPYSVPSGLMLSGNTLYGETARGGSGGVGTVFSLSLPLPQLAIIQSGTNVVLSWLANFTGFTVQSTTNLVSPAVWTPVAPAPVVVNGQNTVTNPISGTQQFYRLQE